MVSLATSDRREKTAVIPHIAMMPRAIVEGESERLEERRESSLHAFLAGTNGPHRRKADARRSREHDRDEVYRRMESGGLEAFAFEGGEEALRHRIVVRVVARIKRATRFFPTR
jgi:hypothetical protein